MASLFKITDMKVKFIKGSRAGEEVDASDKRAAYWQRMGLVEEVFSEEVEQPKELTATEVIAKIKEATTLTELNKLAKGDERKTVSAAYEKKHAELKGG